MTYAPASITKAAAVWVAHGGVNAGIVGSITTHCRGYHLGRDRILGPCACKPAGECRPGQGWNDYSVTLQRDRAGLTDAAAALDLGPIKGSYAALQRFSRWLVAQCVASSADTDDIRELIYSPDGIAIYEWLRDRGEGSMPVRVPNPSTSMLTHRRHTHLSYYRDTEGRDKRPVFWRYFNAPTPQPPAEVDMLPTDFVGQLWTPNASTTAQGRPYRDSPNRSGGKILGYVLPGETFATSWEGTTPDGNNWRCGERVINGDPRPVYYLRGDFDPVTKRGDPFDNEQHAYLARKTP